jgi:hypothetical protein
MYGVKAIGFVDSRIRKVAPLSPLPSLKAAAVPDRQRPFSHPLFNTLDVLAKIEQSAQHFYAIVTPTLKAFEGTDWHGAGIKIIHLLR